MATGGNSRDVRLGIQIDVAGEETLQRAADGVRKLGQSGALSADEFTALVSAFDKLGAQAGSLTGLRAAQEQVDALAARQREAADAAKLLRFELGNVGDVVAPLRQRQQELAESTAAARKAQVDASAALADLRQQYTGAARDTPVFTSRQTELTQALNDARKTIASNNAELVKLKPALTEAAAAERTLAAQYERSAATLSAADAALRERNRALDSARAAALAAGVATEDLAAAENTLLAAARATAVEVERLTQARRQDAAAAAAQADLDAANAAALERQQKTLIEVVAAYDAEQRALADSAAASRAKALADEQAARAAAENAAATRASAAAALSADREFRNAVLSLRATAQAAEELAASDGAAAMRALEQAAQQADAEMRELATSLRSAETAAEQYAAATARAAAAGAQDVEASRDRVAAAQRLIESERSLTAAQSQLASARNANRAALVAEAEALSRAATAARESQAATTAAAVAARQAGAAIEQAFGATGVRSIQAIEAEIEQTSRALTTLTIQARAGGIGLDDLNRAAGAAEVKIARLRAEILQVQAVPGVFERVSASLNDTINRFGALTAVIGTLGIALRPAVESFIALEQSTRILTTISGSATVAGQQIEFLRKTAQNSGQSFDALAQSYAKFAASALQTGLGLQATQDVFASVSNAAGNLGLSSDQAGRALEALSQIASKGVAGMEELRQQLGDALPGVLPALARELGLTNAELNKLVESGGLAAFEAIPAIGRAISTLGTEGGKPVQGLVAEFNRLKNAVLEASSIVANGAFGQALGTVFGVASAAVKVLALGVATLGETFTVVGKQIGTVVAALVTRDFKNLGDALDGITSESAERLTNLANRINGVGTASAGATGRVSALGESMAKVSLAQAEAVRSAEALTRSRETLAQAAEKELEAATQLISLVDDEVDAARRTADAADRVARARVAAAEAANAEVESLRAGRAAVIAKAGSDEQALKGIESLVKAIDEKIVKATADAEKSQASASKALQVAEASRLAAAAIGDQSGAYDKLRDAVDGAQRSYDAVVRAFQRGKATTEDVARADEALVRAKRLLRDALDDQADASKRAVDALKAEADLTKAQIELDLTRLRIKQQELIQRGSLTEATRLGNEIADLELKLKTSGTEAKRAEANEIIRITALRRAELEALGQLTPALRQELDTRIKQQQAIVLQADASVLNEQQQRRENEAVRNGITARNDHTRAVGGNSTAVGGNTGAVNGNTDALTRNAGAAGNAATALDRYNRLLLETRGLDGGVSGNGLAGIGPSQDGVNFGVRSPGGPANQVNGNFTQVGGRTAAGPTAVNRPTSGEWTYTVNPYEVEVKGVDARGNPVPGGWMRVRGSAAGIDGFGGFATQPARTPAPGFGIEPTSPSPVPAAPATTGGGVSLNVTIGGKQYGIGATSQAQADAIIASLEAAYAAGGG